jgi:PEP-CTERM motif
MKPKILTLLIAATALSAPLQAQVSTGTPVTGTVSGAFSNPVAEPVGAPGFVYQIDNDLTDGATGGLNPIPFTAVAGSAAFEWGTPYGTSTSSALWFEPYAFGNIPVESSFDLGRLFYRNGTIYSQTGASQVDLDVAVNIINPALTPALQSTTFSMLLINSPNGADPIASADIVQLGNLASPLTFFDPTGRRYYLETTFLVDQNATDGSLSTMDTFRVFEGQTGQAVLRGRITTDPVPEPSSALMIALAGVALQVRRRRR